MAESVWSHVKVGEPTPPYRTSPLCHTRQHPIQSFAERVVAMSQLLQTILSAKLASASIDDNREAHNDDWEEIHTSDEELVGK